MAIVVVPGTSVGASGGSNVNSINVSAPTLAADDLHVIAVTANTDTATLATPSGYTLGLRRSLANPVGGLSGTSALYVFYRLGPASAGTVNIITSPSTDLGRISAVPFTLTGVDTTTTFDGTWASATSLSAPSRTVTTGDVYLAFYGIREESVAPTQDDSGVIFAPSGTTGIDSESSHLTNPSTPVVTGAVYKDVTAGTVGPYTATTNLVQGVSPTYRLDGSISVVVNAGSVTPTAPGIPVITATAGNTEVDITWTAPLDGGSAITGYTLQRSTTGGGSGFSTINSPSAGATSYTDTGRSNGTTYYYRLSATNAIDTSSYSAEKSATPQAGSTGYIAVVMNTNPAHYYSLNTNYTTQDLGNATTLVDWVTDTTRNATTGTITGPPTFDSTTVNGTSIDSARFTAGLGLKLPGVNPDFSVTKTQQLTIMVHLTVDNYNTSAPSQFTHYMHKADNVSGTREWEWALRYYQDENGSNGGRPRRHSGYYYNRTGSSILGDALGAGSNAQPDLPGSTDGTNMTNIGATNGVAETALGAEHVVIVQYWTTGTGSYPGGIKMFINGVQTDTDTMASYGIIPTLSNDVIRLGRCDLQNSWFRGRVRRIGFWNRLLSQAEITTLTSTSNRALTEGVKGSATVDTEPTQPLNVAATRSAESNSNATVTWSPPDSDGGDAIDSYTVTHDNGGVGSPVVSSPLGSSVRSYDLISLPNVNVNIQVVATNGVGDSTPGTTILGPGPVLAAIGSLSDNFNVNVDPSRTFSTGVTQRNGQLEWDIVDATPRGTYVRGEMVGEAAFYSVGIGTDANVVSCMFVRSTVTPAKQVRIGHVNGSLIARYDDGTPDATPATRAYNAVNDYYWRISDSSGQVSLQTSPDGLTWTNIGRALFATPAWFTDVQVGVEQYQGTGLA